MSGSPSASTVCRRFHPELGLGLTFACLAGIPLLWGQSMPAPPESTHAKLMILGTFHFDDAGLDGYKPKYKIDLMSSERQREVVDLLKSLARFRPNKIAVEWPVEHQTALDTEFVKYLAGSEAAIGLNEIYQVGFRLARRLGHQRVYAIDAPERRLLSRPSTEELIQRAKSSGQDELIERGTKWLQWFDELDAWEDELKTRQTLLEHLRLLNRPDYQRFQLGRYLVAQFEVGGGGDYTGPDWRTGWYNRNLRIFSNLLRLRTQSADRILVIIGAGHVPLLLQMAQSAPEFDSVPALSVLGGK